MTLQFKKQPPVSIIFLPFPYSIRFFADSIEWHDSPPARGKFDFFDGLDGSYKDEILTKDGKLKPSYQQKFRLEVSPYLNTEYMGFLMDTTDDGKFDSPWHNPLVRQAISHCIDREKMLLFLRNNIGIPANAGFVPPALGGLSLFQLKAVKQYNQQQAQELLAKAGYPNGKGLPPLAINTTQNYLDIATYLQKQLKDIGIQATIESSPGPSHRSQVSKGNLQFFRGSWIADYPDAENYLALFYSYNHTPNGPNYTHFNNKLFDELYEKSLSEINDSIRFIYYKRMDQIIIDHAPIVPLYYDKVLRFTQKNIQGLGTNGMNLLDLKRVRK